MAKKFALIVAILLVAVLALSACAATEVYPTEPLTGDSSGAVQSNGGLAVVKGDYVYFINGYPLNGNKVNNVYGKVLVGAILRISLNNLYQASISSNPTQVVEGNAQTVVSKMIYSENKTETYLNGIHIFGDRIYYTTPDVTPDRDGTAQYARLAVKSCNVDGTQTMHHYIFEKSDTVLAFGEASSKVYAAYVQNSNLYVLDLSSENVKPQTVYEGVTSVKYDTFGHAYFINDDGDIYSYTFGGEAKMVVENPSVEGDSRSKVVYTLNNVDNGTLYYTTSSTYKPEVVGVYTTELNGGATRILTYVPGSMYGKDNKLIINDTSAYFLAVYDIATKTATKLVTEEKAITLTSVQDDTIIYTCDSVLKMVKLDTAKVIEVTKIVPISNFMNVDLCGDFVYFVAGEAETNGYSIMIASATKGSELIKIIMSGYIPKLAE